MKKIICFLLVAMMALPLFACGKTPAAPADETTGKTEAPTISTVADLYQYGYEPTTMTGEGNMMAFLFTTEALDSFVRVYTTVTEAQMEEYNSISIFDEDADEKEKAFLLSLVNPTVEKLDHLIPTKEELSVYIGKTLGELQDLGGDESSSILGDGRAEFTYRLGNYECDLTVDPGMEIGDSDDISDEDIRSFVVTDITFVRFSFGVLEEVFPAEEE